MNIESWSKTDVGRVRKVNEDSVLVNDEASLYVVADGMGGHRAGATASKTAIEVINQQVIAGIKKLKKSNTNPVKKLFKGKDPIIQMLEEALQTASQTLLDKVQTDQSLGGMGTTAVCLFAYDDKVYFANVGDSRVYRVRADEITQISVDHSLVQEQCDAGLISKEEAESSRYKNIITRSIGFERQVEVDCEEIEYESGDTFLLCSDGLSGFVKDQEMQEIVNTQPPEKALEFFINLANSRGGDDNISVILVRF